MSVAAVPKNLTGASLDFPHKPTTADFHSPSDKKAIVDVVSKIVVAIFQKDCKKSAMKAKELCLHNPDYEIFTVGSELPLPDVGVSSVFKPPEIQIGDYVVIWEGLVRSLEYAHKVATALARYCPSLAVEEFGTTPNSEFSSLHDIQNICFEAFKLPQEKVTISEDFKHTSSVIEGVREILLRQITKLVNHLKRQQSNRRKFLNLCIEISKQIKLEFELTFKRPQHSYATFN